LYADRILVGVRSPVLVSDTDPSWQFRQEAILGKRHDDTGREYLDAACCKLAPAPPCDARDAATEMPSSGTRQRS
jgi:hypothetical protein